MTSDNHEIGSAGFFIVGYTGDTVESVEKTFALVLSLPLDEAWFSIPLRLPGTPPFLSVSPISGKGRTCGVSNQVKFVFPLGI